MDFDYRRMTERDDKCIPKFHMQSVENVEKSEKAGHPIFEDVPFVTVYTAGNSKEIPDFRVRDRHKERWPKQWEAFLAGSEDPLIGFPLDEWPQITRAQAETLKALGVRTVEELSGGTDEGMRGIGSAYVELRYKALEFLAHHGSEKARIEELEGQNKELLERLDKLEELAALAPKPKKAPTQAQLDSLEKARAAKIAKKEANV